jgi:hypothetical protein
MRRAAVGACDIGAVEFDRLVWTQNPGLSGYPVYLSMIVR